MAKHRKLRNTRIGPLATAAAAVGISATLAVGHAVDASAEPRDLVIGVGGALNPTSDRVRDKFRGELVADLEAAGYTFEGVQYSAWPLPIDPSVAEGVPKLHTAIDGADGGRVVVIGYSEGALVAERVRRDLSPTAGGPVRDSLDFVMVASPFVPNGGIYARFPGLRLPGFTSTGPSQPSEYDTTYYSREYDLIADFPAYGNPLSLANAVAGLLYYHGDRGADPVDLDTHPVSVREVVNGKGGTDVYVLIRSEHLPLLQPIRDLSALTGTTVFTEPVLRAVEPSLRLLVDMGYTDRDYRTIGVDETADYQDADQPTRFSLATPADRVRETAAALPGAIRDGLDNFVDAVTPKTTKPKPKTTEPAEDDEEDEPLKSRVEDAADDADNSDTSDASDDSGDDSADAPTDDDSTEASDTAAAA
ncbi:PE-PPE domain-containing protein [Mycolicibacterium litorale]|uniref:PE-PPE domain-containing protein n=1 Tax=Mycolicibacterium litorale TaxID=758802 RepID=UPI003CF61E7B